MKKNTSLLLLLFLCLFGVFTAKAQEGIVSSGGNASGSSGSASLSVGQIFYTTVIGSGGSLSEGIQQTLEIETLSNPDFKDVQLKMAAYPNPTTDVLILTLETLNQDNLSFEMYDLLGKLILKKSLKNTTNTIEMAAFISGTYLLAVKNKNQTLKTYKIIKK